MKKNNTTTTAPEQKPLQTPLQDNGHTPGVIKTGSELPGDEYKCCILNDEGRLLAQTFPNPYFSVETAEANAARIVECWNNYDQLKADNERLFERVSSFHKAVTRYKNEITKLKSDNKELIQELQGMIDEFDGIVFSDKSDPLIAKAKKSITKHSQ